MRKILAALFTCVTAIVLMCVGVAWSSTAATNLTSQGTTPIMLAGRADVLNGTLARQWVEAIPEQFGVDVERVVSSSAGLTDVYASDMTLGGRVRLESGAFPLVDEESDAYVASADTGSELQTGSFALFSPQTQVLIHPLDALAHRDSYLGELHLRTTDSAKVEEILAYLRAHVGPAFRLDGQSYEPSADASGASAPVEDGVLPTGVASGASGSDASDFAGDASASADSSSGSAVSGGGGGVVVTPSGADILLGWLFMNPIVAGAAALLFFLTVFACVRYAIRESRDVAILRLGGAGLPRTLVWHAARLAPCALTSAVIGAAGLIIAVGVVLRSPFALPAFLLVDLACAAGLLTLALLVLALTTALQNARYGVARVIAGKRPFAALTTLQFVLKYAVLAVVLVGVVQVSGNVRTLRQADAANDDWKRVEDTYYVAVKDVGQTAAEQTGDDATMRAFVLKTDATYQAMRDGQGLVLAYTTNFSDMGDGRELWEVNTGPDSYTQEPWWSPDGRTLVVNKNYLDVWPVHAADGTDVRDLLTHDETGRTRTVLVPESLREHEDEIRQLFLEGFAFQKLRIHELVGESAGEEPLGLTQDDLRIKIIYVPDGLGWFTYRSDVAEQTGNRVIDPLVIVDDHEADPDFYYAWMTSSCFYETNPYDPTRALRQTAERFGADDMLNSVYSVYDQRADQLAQVRSQLVLGLLCGGMLVAGAVLCVYLFATCWYVQHRRQVMVRRLHGWPMVRIAGPMIALSVALSATLALAWPGELALGVRLVLPVADLLVTLTCCWLAQRAQVALALKGEG